MKNKSLFFALIIISQMTFAKKIATNYNSWAIQIANSEIKHYPKLWKIDFASEPQWNYTHGLVAKAMLKVFENTKNEKYYEYVKTYAEFFINNDGDILSYNPKDYDLNKLNAGNFLFDMYRYTRNPKYLKAIHLLREQLYTQPRVKDGPFWQNKIYPHQIWLDGLYMSAPFYAHYAAIFDKYAIFNDLSNQLNYIDKYTLDPLTGLNYQGWDESRSEKWANNDTGQSSSFCSRSIGLYLMTIVDILDYLPYNYPDRNNLIATLNRITKSLLKFQDKKTGMWFQVTNLNKRPGNYLESSGTAMFTYVMAKGINKGYLPSKYSKSAIKAFDGLIKFSSIQNADSTTSITNACASTGLGGNPYRDGSFEYYIGEPVRNDDSKVVAPFIMAALELETMSNKLSK